MQRGATGRYQTTSVGGEKVRAFIPNALPPKPPLSVDGSLQRRVEAAALRSFEKAVELAVLQHRPDAPSSGTLGLLIGVADAGTVVGIEHDQLESDDKFMRHR